MYPCPRACCSSGGGEGEEETDALPRSPPPPARREERERPSEGGILHTFAEAAPSHVLYFFSRQSKVWDGLLLSLYDDQRTLRARPRQGGRPLTPGTCK
jgi:hypothetical protein